MVLKNNYRRLIKEKKYLILAILVSFFSVFVSAYVTTMDSPKLSLGVVGEIPNQMRTGNFKVDQVKKDEPKYFTNLITGKYDAYIVNENNHFVIETTKGNGLKNKINDMLLMKSTGKKLSNSEKGENKMALSLLAMTMMILSLILCKYYFDERNGANQRILLGNISTSRYVLDHLLTIFSLLFICSGLSILVLFPSFSISVSFLLILFIALICLFSSAFGMFVSSFTQKNQGALLIGTMVTVLSSLISGSIISIDKDSMVYPFHFITPQYFVSELGQFLDNSIDNVAQPLLYLTGVTVLFLLVTIQKNKKIIENE